MSKTLRVAMIVPGSGGTFYCQNCLRDISLVGALRQRGCDMVFMPMYLPMMEETSAPLDATPVFYGALNTYLLQAMPGFGRLPAAVRKWLDAMPLLRAVARVSGSTRANGLEEMTLSMLRGKEGRQARELETLLGWFRNQEKPDLIHLSNALLLGLAAPLKNELGIPVVCSLQDEDTWVNAMRPRYRERVWDMMARKAQAVDRFVAVSSTCARAMAKYMRLADEHCVTVPIGIELAPFGAPRAAPPDPPALGFLSRLSETLGLGILADAFLLLKTDARFANLRLHMTGGLTGEDRRFVKRLQRRFRAAGVDGDVSVQADFSREARIRFLKSLSVLSVPAPEGESFGLFQIEAMAAGVPVVQPDAGAFPEMVAATGGGVIYQPNTPGALAVALSELLLDRDRLTALGQHGRESVFRDFSLARMAERMTNVYAAVIDRTGGRGRME